jgi:hypothetical protein
MNGRTYVLGSALALFSVGCGFSTGFIRDSTTTHEVRYDASKGFRYVRSVSAAAREDNVLCLFPMSRPAYATAMQELNDQAKLQPGQVILNMREDRVLTVFIVLCRVTTTVSGDVFEFTQPPAVEKPADAPKPTSDAPTAQRVPEPTTPPGQAPPPMASEPNPFSKAPF